MKKYMYTHEDREQEIITARFTKEELTMIRYALFVFGSVEVNEDNEKLNDDTLRKKAAILDCKLRQFKGINMNVLEDFIETYIP